MMEILSFLALIALALVVVVYVLPVLPRWMRVGFWLVLTISHIVNDDALFAAITAAITMSEWRDE